MRGVEQIPWLYDLLIRLFPRLAHWRATLLAQAHGRTLEIGCGTGLGLCQLAQHVDQLWGIDPSADSLRRAKARVPSAALAIATAEHLPFPDNAFDCVVSSLVFCSVNDPQRGLAEIRRVLAPGGQLLMLEHVQAKGRLTARALDVIQPLWTGMTGGCHPNRHTEETVRAAGFTIDPDAYLARGVMRRFIAHPDS